MIKYIQHNYYEMKFIKVEIEEYKSYNGDNLQIFREETTYEISRSVKFKIRLTKKNCIT